MRSTGSVHSSGCHTEEELVLALVSSGLKPQLIVFANKALLFCPLRADGSWKVCAERRCLCRDVNLVRCGGRTHWMGSVW